MVPTNLLIPHKGWHRKLADSGVSIAQPKKIHAFNRSANIRFALFFGKCKDLL